MASGYAGCDPQRGIAMKHFRYSFKLLKLVKYSLLFLKRKEKELG